MRKTIIFIIFCIFLVAVSACGSNQTLKIGVNDGYRPFSYKENGEQKGFEIDLWKAIAKQGDIPYEFVSKSSGDIIKELGQKKLDVGIAGITIKQSRKKAIDFSTSYLHTGQMMAIRKDNLKTKGLDDLKKKVVATKIGTTGYEYASRIDGIKKIIAFPKIEDAFEALKKGEADAVIYDTPGITYFEKNQIEKNQKNQMHMRSIGKKLTEEHYAIAFPKGSRQLGRVNNALRDVVKSGEFEKIYRNWFDQAPASLPGEKN